MEPQTVRGFEDAEVFEPTIILFYELPNWSTQEKNS